MLTLTQASDSGGSSTDRITSVTRPIITGTAEAGSNVVLSLDGAAAVTLQADAAGTFSFTPATPLSDGTHSLTANTVGGDPSAATSLTFTIDTAAPVHTLALSSGTGTGPDGNRPLATDPATGATFLNAADFARAFRLSGTVSEANLGPGAGAIITFTAADGHQVPSHSVYLQTDGSARFAFRIDARGTAGGANSPVMRSSVASAAAL